MSKDYYEILGLSKTCSEDEIKKAYRKLVLKAHPDKGGDPEEFKAISEAYSVLSTPDKRKLYDQYGKEGLEMGEGGMPNPEDIFNSFFGGMGNPFGGMNVNFGGNMRREQKRRDKIQELEISLEDIFNGKTKNINVERIIIDQTKVKNCNQCDGKGVRIAVIRLGPGMVQQQVQECNACSGAGKDVDKQYIKTKQEMLVLEIPKFCRNDTQIRFSEKANDFPGQPTGDLIFVIKYKPHKTFKVEGPNIKLELQISLYEALCGFSRKIKYLDNTILNIKSTNIIKPNDIKCIHNEGLQYDNRRGHLILEFNIEFPDTIVTDNSSVLASILKHKPITEEISNFRNVILQDYNQERHHERHQNEGHRVQECTHQ